MSYGGFPYGDVGYAGAEVAQIPSQTQTTVAIEMSLTTSPFAEPVWVDYSTDVRSWSTSRGRRRELERFQPGRATIVFSNLTRAYDSQYAAGPNYGNLTPMKRVRIRETFDGVTYPIFDGYVDKWQLDYPGTGTDAIAILTATDGFKPLARTDLQRSLYDFTVLGDSPSIFWRAEEDLTNSESGDVAPNAGTLGAVANATYTGPPLQRGQNPLVTLDPGTSIFTNQDTLGTSVFLLMGLTGPVATAFDLFSQQAFSLECWCLPIQDPPGTVQDNAALWSNADGGANAAVVYDVTNARFSAYVVNDASTVYQADSATNGAPRGSVYHVVMSWNGTGSKVQLWVNGVLTESGASAGTFTTRTGARTHFGNVNLSPGNNNFSGSFSHGAGYLGSKILDATKVAAHYAAGTSPWSGDLPGVRLGRVLDIVGIPLTQRELDAGEVTFQSVAFGITALEHCQKVSESEHASLFFWSRDGKARFVGRTAIFGRQSLFTFGDSAGEVGYRNFVPDDGDENIRNRATISRLNGVAKTAENAVSITAFGKLDFILDGLLHNTDTYSQDYANFVVDQYGSQRRRITSLDLGPPITGEESTVYPAMLGLELGNAITFRNRPLGSTLFEQVCAVEGIEQEGSPGGMRTTRLTLSPEYPLRALENAAIAFGYGRSAYAGAGKTS